MSTGRQTSSVQHAEGRRLLESFVAPHASWSERIEAGKARRQTVPRSAHGEYRPSRKRADPVKVLEQQNATRLPWLVPVRMGRMAASPFAFLRGAAAIMAADLSGTARTGLEVMACGDMHLLNVGLFSSAERNLVFAINDFDEVHPGPWEWDLKRLAASAALAAMNIGGGPADAQTAAHAAVASYVKRINRYSEMGFMEVWYDLIDERTILDVVPQHLSKETRAIMAKARVRGRMRALDRLTEEVDGQQRIVEHAPLIVHETRDSTGAPIQKRIDKMLRSYLTSLPEDRRPLLARYRIIDVARKVVGVGSVGLSCWVILLEGLDTGDPLFLQVKEARPSVLAPYVESQQTMRDQGQRVVVGQRMIQGSPDIFLGWGPAEMDGGQFYVRQLADMKGGVRFTEGDRKELDSLVEYSRLCGWALALAHAKSGDPAMIAGYCGKGDALPDAIARFALAYLDQTERDHAALVAAIKKGRIAAADG